MADVFFQFSGLVCTTQDNQKGKPKEARRQVLSRTKTSREKTVRFQVQPLLFLSLSRSHQAETSGEFFFDHGAYQNEFAIIPAARNDFMVLPKSSKFCFSLILPLIMSHGLGILLFPYDNSQFKINRRSALKPHQPTIHPHQPIRHSPFRGFPHLFPHLERPRIQRTKLL